MSETTHRRSAILDLLGRHEVRSQAQLHALLSEHGLGASQPVLSRDLRALQVAKQAGTYQVLEEQRVTPLTTLRSLLRGSQPVHSLVLVRCESGAANAVARALEAEGIEGLAGTIAGDDTVLVAVETKVAGQRVRGRVSELLGS